MKIIFFVGIALCTSFTLATFQSPVNQTETVSITTFDQDDKKENIRTAARRIFMRGKLSSNQTIVEGLATNDFEKITDGADQVKALVKGQHWFVIDTEKYKQYSKDMERAATQLHSAAMKKNMDAAALRYFALTMNCIDCHRYIDSRKR